MRIQLQMNLVETLEPLTFQFGANEGQNLKIPLYDHRDFRLFLKDIALSPYSSAMEALQRVDDIVALNTELIRIASNMLIMS